MLSAEGASSRTDLSDDERAALVAALLSVSTPSDAPLLRELTSQEIAFVERADTGCGDVLLACCWLLFVNGQVEDSALVWRAKNVNFDAHCYVDSVFLVAHGVRATAEFARSAGLVDLAEWVEDDSSDDVDADARELRDGAFFEDVPAASAPVEELAQWIRQ